MSAEKRPYHMRRREHSQEQTRLRITESAVALHGTLGPSRTSISAIAAHAGVRRSTVYRHFADEAAVFDACTAHWTAAALPADQTINGSAKDDAILDHRERHLMEALAACVQFMHFIPGTHSTVRVNYVI